MPPHPILAELRLRIASLERGGAAARRSHLPFGNAAVDAALPGGGVARAAVHEVAGAGLEYEHGAAASLFVAGILARLRGPVLWVLTRHDLFAPGLAGVGLHPRRVVYAETADRDAVMPVMEEGLRARGLAAVVGEVDAKLPLGATRRLQLAAEGAGVTGFVLRRGRAMPLARIAGEPSAAVTRWRIGALPSAPPLPHAPDVPGLGRARWRVDLVRCRGGEPCSWDVEGCDAKGRLGLAAPLADRSVAALPSRRVA